MDQVSDLCTKCGREPRELYQRWGKKCRSEYQKQWRKDRQDRALSASNLLKEIAEYVPEDRRADVLRLAEQIGPSVAVL